MTATELKCVVVLSDAGSWGFLALFTAEVSVSRTGPVVHIVCCEICLARRDCHDWFTLGDVGGLGVC